MTTDDDNGQNVIRMDLAPRLRPPRTEEDAAGGAEVFEFPRARTDRERVEQEIEAIRDAKMTGAHDADDELETRYIGLGPATDDGSGVAVSLDGIDVRRLVDAETGALGNCWVMSASDARTISDRLEKAARMSDRYQLQELGVRVMYRCRVDGKPAYSGGGSVEVVIVERSGRRVRVEPSKARSSSWWAQRRSGCPEPPESLWFNEETGEPDDRESGRRHWRLGRAPRR